VPLPETGKEAQRRQIADRRHPEGQRGQQHTGRRGSFPVTV
jgi:hypothetical protein